MNILWDYICNTTTGTQEAKRALKDARSNLAHGQVVSVFVSGEVYWIDYETDPKLVFFDGDTFISQAGGVERRDSAIPAVIQTKPRQD